MLKALLKLFGYEENDPSGKVAKDRLRVVLIHDRANISPEVVNHIKDDIIKSCAKDSSNKSADNGICRSIRVDTYGLHSSEAVYHCKKNTDGY